MSNGQKTCFVIMGFGEKTDFQSNPQRVLNLDRTYNNIIKPVVEEASLACIRADEIIHSTVIDKPMYDNLLSADIVLADLSTSNANAIYELGIRHALRPRTTIVMAENNFSFPFDLNHLSILKYEHLGTDIGYAEVMRVRALLKNKILNLINRQETDSPIFLLIPSLRAAGPSGQALDVAPGTAPAPMALKKDDSSFAALMESFHVAKVAVKKPADWAVPLELLKRMETMQPEDPYILQQRALATYKSEIPDKRAALAEAKKVLQKLAPVTSSDAETVGLWGAIHKHLWDLGSDPIDLDEAIRAYARGFYIKDDYYNGINYAFVLDVRAASSTGDEAIADRVLARRVRKEVLAICDGLLAAEGRESHLADDERFPARRPQLGYWVYATKLEALMGLGRVSEAAALKSQISTPEDWQRESLSRQLYGLAKTGRAEVLARYGIIDGPDLTVDLIQEAGVMWRVAIRAVGNPVTALPPSRALELSVELRQIGDEKLADRIALHANKAPRYQDGK